MSVKLHFSTIFSEPSAHRKRSKRIIRTVNSMPHPKPTQKCFRDSAPSLERSGLLIEAVPDYASGCRFNSPLATVVNTACVATGQEGGEVDIHQVGLMSLIDGARDEKSHQEWISRGEEVQNMSRKSCRAPARTLSSILDEQGVTQIDLLSLDVEGLEKQVLNGLDFNRHSLQLMLVEDSLNGDLLEYLSGFGYELVEILNERTFTRDLLLRQKVT